MRSHSLGDEQRERALTVTKRPLDPRGSDGDGGRGLQTQHRDLLRHEESKEQQKRALVQAHTEGSTGLLPEKSINYKEEGSLR